MKESDLNTFIKNSWLWGSKIPDPPKAVATQVRQNPFDGFSIFDTGVCYYETKLLKNMKAFPFDSIREHQIYNLVKISEIAKKQKLGIVWPVILLGIWISRKSLNLFAFHIDYIVYLKNQGKKSLSKKDLLEFEQAGKYFPIEKGVYDFSNFASRVINENF